APFFNPNPGKLQVKSGRLSLTGGGSGTGVFQADPTGTLEYPVDYEVDGFMTGAGTNLLSGGGLTFKGTNSGQFIWTGGGSGRQSSGRVNENGVLLLEGIDGGDNFLSSTLTNAGTIRLVSGNLNCTANAGFGGTGQLVNLSTGTIDFQSDVSVDYDNTGGGNP